MMGTKIVHAEKNWQKREDKSKQADFFLSSSTLIAL